ncbi:sensor histidine kinase [Phragmitibacter flavus]|nr:ABC transporter substrate binding protein [Phragmitibacter flavus]
MSQVFFLFFAFGWLAQIGIASASEPSPKRVLLLYSERAGIPAIQAIDAGLVEAFAARGNVEVFSEYFDFARFPAKKHAEGQVEHLHDRYGGLKLDKVIVVGFETLKFVIQHREKLFPGVPVTFCGIERHLLSGTTLPPDVNGVVLNYDFRRTIELALKLQPGLKDVVCVFGSSAFDQQVGHDALAALAEYPQLRVRRLDTTPYAEIIEQVRHLPRNTMVFHISMLRDSSGQTRLSPRVAEEISNASSVPVYSVALHHLERGVIGGAMMDYAAHGKEIGNEAVARLDGRPPTPNEAASSPWIINWQALKKWKIPEALVPSDALIKYKPPTLWEEHPGLITGILAVVLIQSILIALLLVNIGNRCRAERALAESEERMGLAAAAAGLGMWVWDVRGNTWMTEQGRALFGFKPEAELDYAAILDRVHPEDRSARELAIKRALDTRGKYEMEYRVQLPDGSMRWVSARGHCVAEGNGKTVKLLGVSMDITHRKQAELEALQQRAELSHLSRVALVGEMATTLAHELNQPLTAIVTNASAAQRFIAHDDMDPDELREMLTDIAADGRRAGDIIRGIKGMVRKVASERRKVDMIDVINDVLRLVRADALANGCAITTHLEKNLPLVLGDPVQLQQVLLNLIVNAFDAMRRVPCEPCRVEIASSLDNESVEVSVRDFGPGLPDEDRVFERFFSTKSDGMGMGLAIARSIIETHGGTLTAENMSDGGARFWLRLPAQVPIHEEATV